MDITELCNWVDRPVLFVEILEFVKNFDLTTLTADCKKVLKKAQNDSERKLSLIESARSLNSKGKISPKEIFNVKKKIKNAFCLDI
jgi:hypothetical protein